MLHALPRSTWSATRDASRSSLTTLKTRNQVVLKILCGVVRMTHVLVKIRMFDVTVTFS